MHATWGSGLLGVCKVGYHSNFAMASEWKASNLIPWKDFLIALSAEIQSSTNLPSDLFTPRSIKQSSDHFRLVKRAMRWGNMTRNGEEEAEDVYYF
ncbi:hypothetical protein D5086_010652 [Populus alba]|uniref:Uncharacterized protein n=1 Tax=Populus alba TaxID=43335 RepID=A0ACC4C9Z3_POPAL